MKLRTILHPTDFSDGAHRAFELAVRLAATHGAGLHIFHAVLPYADDQEQTEAQLAAHVADARRRGRQLLEEAVAADELRLNVSREPCISVFDAILDVTRRSSPDLIVMGTHGRSDADALAIGSVAEKVLRHARCSVMTVRPDARVSTDGRFHSLLVPVDFSDGSRRALDEAMTVASQTGAGVSVLHVVEPVPALYHHGGESSALAVDPGLRGRIVEKMRGWCGEANGATLLVTEGSAPLEIARVAEEVAADLVLMSTRGLTGLDRMLLGSVTERTCRFAATPVLAVR